MIILEECLFYKVFVEIYCLGDFGLRLLQKSFNFATNLHQADIFDPQKTILPRFSAQDNSLSVFFDL